MHSYHPHDCRVERTFKQLCKARPLARNVNAESVRGDKERGFSRIADSALIACGVWVKSRFVAEQAGAEKAGKDFILIRFVPRC
jgi:hypothetical protein